MVVSGKFEVEVDIKSCGDLFHELFKSKPHHIANIVPDKIHACQVHEGDFGLPGSVVNWNYTLDGKKSVAKELIEAVDVANKIVRFRIIEGDLLKDYKSMTITVHVLPSKGGMTGVKWILEFEKVADDGPYPTNVLDFCIGMTKGIEGHHLKA